MVFFSEQQVYLSLFTEEVLHITSTFSARIIKLGANFVTVLLNKAFLTHTTIQ